MKLCTSPYSDARTLTTFALFVGNKDGSNCTRKYSVIPFRDLRMNNPARTKGIL
jgi:hypothetical protein